MKKWLFCKNVILVIALALALPLTANAVDLQDFKLKTTQDLFDLCSTDEDNPKYVAAIHACHGYIAGAIHYHDAVTDREDLKRLICYPPTAVMSEAIIAYLSWCKANQGNKEIMSEAPVIGVVKALAGKYPCKKK